MVQIHKELIDYMDNCKDERKKQCRYALEEHVKSSTDAVCKNVEEKKREHEDVVDRLKDKLQDLHLWLLKAGNLE